MEKGELRRQLESYKVRGVPSEHEPSVSTGVLTDITVTREAVVEPAMAGVGTDGPTHGVEEVHIPADEEGVCLLLRCQGEMTLLQWW